MGTTGRRRLTPPAASSSSNTWRRWRRCPPFGPHLRLRTRVLGVSRMGLDRTKTADRGDAPFVLRVESDGVESDVMARAVIDASGTYESPNPLGASGLPAIGEAAALRADLLRDPGCARAGTAPATPAAGSWWSAAATPPSTCSWTSRPWPRTSPQTRIVWAIRRPAIEGLFGGGDKDQLEERGRLGDAACAIWPGAAS